LAELLLLMMHYWRKGEVPGDDKQLAKRPYFSCLKPAAITPMLARIGVWRAFLDLHCLVADNAAQEVPSDFPVRIRVPSGLQ
jgi:hypothetical protein